MTKQHAVLGALALGAAGFAAGLWTGFGSPPLPDGVAALIRPAAAQSQRRPAQDDPILFYRDPMGEPAVSLRLLRSSDAGDYRADARMMSDCVFVRHGAAGRAAGGADFVYAFVSGRNGRVYRQLSECRESR